MAWKIRSARDFVLGIIALAGAVIAGILLFTVIPAAVATLTLPQILALIIGAVLFFGGFALLARGIQGR